MDSAPNNSTSTKRMAWTDWLLQTCSIRLHIGRVDTRLLRHLPKPESCRGRNNWAAHRIGNHQRWNQTLDALDAIPLPTGLHLTCADVTNAICQLTQLRIPPLEAARLT